MLRDSQLLILPPLCLHAASVRSFEAERTLPHARKIVSAAGAVKVNWSAVVRRDNQQRALVHLLRFERLGEIEDRVVSKRHHRHVRLPIVFQSVCRLYRAEPAVVRLRHLQRRVYYMRRPAEMGVSRARGLAGGVSYQYRK